MNSALPKPLPAALGRFQASESRPMVSKITVAAIKSVLRASQRLLKPQFWPRAGQVL